MPVVFTWMTNGFQEANQLDAPITLTPEIAVLKTLWKTQGAKEPRSQWGV